MVGRIKLSRVRQYSHRRFFVLSTRHLQTVLTVLSLIVLILPTPATAYTPQERRNFAAAGIYFIDAPCAIEGYPGGSNIDISEVEKTNARIVIGIAKTMNLGPEGARIGLITALVESGLKNYANDGTYADDDEDYSTTRLGEISKSFPHDAVGNDHDSVGIMQQRVTGGWAGIRTPPHKHDGAPMDNWGNLSNPEVIGRLMNPAFAAQAFYERMIAIPDWQSKEPGFVAQTVQVSAYPSRYSKRIPDADALIQELWDTSPAIPLVVPSNTTISPDVASTDCYNSGRQAVYDKIMEYAWPRFRDPRSNGNAEGINGCIGNCVRKGAYARAVSRSSYDGGCRGVDCGAFVTIVMRDSGADPEYNTNNECNTRCQLDYLRRNSGPGGKYMRVTKESDLQPVDLVIAIRDDGMFGGLVGHTFIYIGDALNGRTDEAGIEWSGVTASASLCGRAPMASGMDNFDEYEWYRLN